MDFIWKIDKSAFILFMALLMRHGVRMSLLVVLAERCHPRSCLAQKQPRGRQDNFAPSGQTISP